MADPKTPEYARPMDGAAARPQWSSRLIGGLILLTLGALFTLDNFGVLEARPILRWWPVLLLGIGLCKLTGFCASRHLVWGILFTFFGGMWLLESLRLIDFDVWDLWPVVLIVLGGTMLMRGLRPSVLAGEKIGNPDLRSVAIMSGVDRKLSGSVLRSAELTAVMGGVELDLTGAKLENNRALIEVFVWWGGVDLKVPEGWRVVNEGLAIMGAVEDGTRPVADESAPTIVIRGLVVMGGVELKH